MYAPEPAAGLHLVGRANRPLGIDDTSVRIALRGDLDARGAPLLRLHLLSLACDGGPSEIIVDLSRVTWIDRAGSHPLLEAQGRQRSRGAVLRMVRPSVPVQRFFGADSPLTEVPVPDPGIVAGQGPPGTPGLTLSEARGRGAQLAANRLLLAEIDQLKQALETRDVIGQAKGVISLLYGCPEDTAFALLRRASQDTHRKVRDLAVLVTRAAADGTQLPADVAAHLRPISRRRRAVAHDPGQTREPAASEE